MSRTVGRVVRTTARGDLLLDLSSDVDPRRVMGGVLVDARHKPVAKVTDVVGPVSAPVVVASAWKGQTPHRLIGRDLHLAPPRKRKRHGGKGRPQGRSSDRGDPSRGRGRQGRAPRRRDRGAR